MRILVTGGAGFIGSHVVDRFVSLGHDVTVLDDLSSGVRTQVNAAARLAVHDIRSSGARDVVRAFAPEVICHHAAQMDVRRSVAEPAFDADVNITGLLHVLEAARVGGALQHVTFASSGGAMYGEQSTYPAPETHAVRPESPYGLSKGVSELYLDWYTRTYGIGHTALRYANVYGPRQNPHGEAGVVAIFCARLLEGTPITIYGDGEQTRDYVFVDDVVEANARALEHRLQGGFNVGTGMETSVKTIASTLKRLAHSNSDVVFAAGRPGEQRRSVIDPAKLKAATGFAPQTSLDDGLVRTLDFFRAKRAAS